ncbi:MAG: glycoside hydrolase family 11 protein [Lachnospiraceae bacterium]|nr:glycoside hydrolase family 11 protein [Lachnospiraceae bacterium]
MKLKRLAALIIAMTMIVGISSGIPVSGQVQNLACCCSSLVSAPSTFVHSWASCCGAMPTNGSHNCPRFSMQINSNLNTGNISVSWQSKSAGVNNQHGIGWSIGRDNRVMNYNAGAFNQTGGGTGCTYLTAYGWFRSPIAEWYIVDRWVNYGNTTGINHGTVNADGGTYRIITENMTGPNITGNGPFTRVKSIRTAQRAIGQNNSITFQNHVNRWRQITNPDLRNLSQHGPQAVIIESYNSSGNANFTVWGN